MALLSRERVGWRVNRFGGKSGLLGTDMNYNDPSCALAFVFITEELSEWRLHLNICGSTLSLTTPLWLAIGRSRATQAKLMSASGFL